MNNIVAQRSGSFRRSRGLDPEVIEGFPILDYAAVKTAKIGNDALECAVCLTKFEDDDSLRLIPRCDHVFHPDCIDAWLVGHTTCPVCRCNLAEKLDNDVEQPLVVNVDEVRESNNNNDRVNEENKSMERPLHERMRRSHTMRNQSFGRPRWSSKLVRSLSSGHVEVKPLESMERFTLRLPEDVRKQIMSGKLKRRNSARGLYQSRGLFGSLRDRANRSWGFSLTPPFLTPAPSMRSLDGEFTRPTHSRASTWTGPSLGNETAGSQPPTSKPTSSKAMAQLTSKKRATESQAAEGSKKKKTGTHSRPASTSSKVHDVSPIKDVSEDAKGAFNAPRNASGSTKSVKEPLTDATAPVSGQGFGQGYKGKTAITISAGNLIPTRVKSYRQSSETSLDSTPGSEVGSLYSQYLKNRAGAERSPDLPEITRKMLAGTPMEFRETLQGYHGGDLNKIQNCLAEALIRVAGAKTWQRMKSSEVREAQRRSRSNLDTAQYTVHKSELLTHETLENQAIVSLNLKKDLEDERKKNKTLSAELQKVHTEKLRLETAQKEKAELKKKVTELEQKVSELTTANKDLEKKVAGAEDEKVAGEADGQVEKKIRIAWESHYDWSVDWFLKMYKWASQLFHYREGICGPPLSLENQMRFEDNLPLESKEGQGDERFEKPPKPIGEEEAKADQEAKAEHGEDESPDA
uniref:RING-type E3 ubiquitin transferase n=1 Tax=Chenopodium quinoa TaxID=63459 RepID=A0A803KQJ2_CHEQI